MRMSWRGVNLAPHQLPASEYDQQRIALGLQQAERRGVDVVRGFDFLVATGWLWPLLVTSRVNVTRSPDAGALVSIEMWLREKSGALTLAAAAHAISAV